MPAIVKTETDEKLWEKAKTIVSEEYGRNEKQGKRYWRLVTAIFKRMQKSLGQPWLVIRKSQSNYKLHYQTDFQGIKISVENRKGSIRRGQDRDGHKWETKMQNAYGRIPYSEGVDNEHVDCYVGPNKNSMRVFVIHQVRPKNGAYDEDKVMIGFNTPKQAKRAYLKHYDSPKFFGSMTELTIDEFKDKLKSRKGKIIKSYRHSHWRKIKAGKKTWVTGHNTKQNSKSPEYVGFHQWRAKYLKNIRPASDGLLKFVERLHWNDKSGGQFDVLRNPTTADIVAVNEAYNRKPLDAPLPQNLLPQRTDGKFIYQVKQWGKHILVTRTDLRLMYEELMRKNPQAMGLQREVWGKSLILRDGRLIIKSNPRWNEEARVPKGAKGGGEWTKGKNSVSSHTRKLKNGRVIKVRSYKTHELPQKKPKNYTDILHVSSMIESAAEKLGYRVSIEEAKTTLSTYLDCSLYKDDNDDNELIASAKIRVSNHKLVYDADISVDPSDESGYEPWRAVALLAKRAGKPLTGWAKRQKDAEDIRVAERERKESERIAASKKWNEEHKEEIAEREARQAEKIKRRIENEPALQEVRKNEEELNTDQIDELIKEKALRVKKEEGTVSYIGRVYDTYFTSNPPKLNDKAKKKVDGEYQWFRIRAIKQLRAEGKWKSIPKDTKKSFGIEISGSRGGTTETSEEIKTGKMTGVNRTGLLHVENTATRIVYNGSRLIVKSNPNVKNQPRAKDGKWSYSSKTDSERRMVQVTPKDGSKSFYMRVNHSSRVGSKTWLSGVRFESLDLLEANGTGKHVTVTDSLNKIKSVDIQKSLSPTISLNQAKERLYAKTRGNRNSSKTTSYDIEKRHASA